VFGKVIALHILCLLYIIWHRLILLYESFISRFLNVCYPVLMEFNRKLIATYYNFYLIETFLREFLSQLIQALALHFPRYIFALQL